jgi:hypothetical protein
MIHLESDVFLTPENLVQLTNHQPTPDCATQCWIRNKKSIRSLPFPLLQHINLFSFLQVSKSRASPTETLSPPITYMETEDNENFLSIFSYISN